MTMLLPVTSTHSCGTSTFLFGRENREEHKKTSFFKGFHQMDSLKIAALNMTMFLPVTSAHSRGTSTVLFGRESNREKHKGTLWLKGMYFWDSWAVDGVNLEQWGG